MPSFPFFQFFPISRVRGAARAQLSEADVDGPARGPQGSVSVQRRFYYNLSMSFCEHCDGQRFDRARVLRALRQVRKDLRAARQGAKCDAAIVAAMNAIRALDIPHLEWEAEEDAVIH